ASYVSPSASFCRNSWIRPLTSCSWANAALPITRLASRRPPSATLRSPNSSTPSYSACRSPAWSRRRKSLGNAMPCARNSASLARRSAIRWFSSSIMSRIHSLGTHFKSGLQARLDELVEVAVEHVLRVGALDAGAQVLDPALVEHVVADLAAPADVGLGRLDRVAFGIALLHLQLVELGRQHLHRAVAVGVLAAFGLARDHDPGRHMGDAHRRLGLVDVLAAGAGGAVDVGLQVGRIDLDVDPVVDFRRHEHRGEAGMATVVGVE